jgi:hypothetical protein
MQTLLVVVVVAAAILWAALRLRRFARAASHPEPICPGCAGCPQAGPACAPGSCELRPGPAPRGPHARPRDRAADHRPSSVPPAT